MPEYLILDKKDSNVSSESIEVIYENELWANYLKQICLLRGKVYIDEGLYDKDILCEDGQFKEKWDHDSIHFVALDAGKIVGALRLTPLQKNNEIQKAEIDYFFEKFHLPKHKKTFDHLLNTLIQEQRVAVELSRLIVEEEYRRFRNINSQVSAVLFTMSYSYATANAVNDAFIVQGNKYQTSNIYERIGFSVINDVDTNTPLETFYDGSDICQLMHLELEHPSDLFQTFIDKFFDKYKKAKVIKKC